MPLTWLLPGAVVRLHDGDLHAVGWGEGLQPLVTQIKTLGLEWDFKKIELDESFLSLVSHKVNRERYHT